MTTTTATNGRLCNQIIRNLAVEACLRRSTVVCGLYEVAVQFVLWSIEELYCGANRYGRTRRC
jgi:hypothetical protein